MLAVKLFLEHVCSKAVGEKSDKITIKHCMPLFMVSNVISLVRSENLVTLIFTKTTFCQRGNTKSMEHILSKSRSSRPIRTALKSINYASKYCIYEKFHYFGAHFTEIRGFALRKILKMS